MEGKIQFDNSLHLDLEDLNLKEKCTINSSLQEILTDDESENEAKELKKLFFSRNTAHYGDSSRNEAYSPTELIQTTHYSSGSQELADRDDKGAVRNNYSESLFSQNDALKNDLDQLSVQINRLLLSSPDHMETKSDINCEEHMKGVILGPEKLTNVMNLTFNERESFVKKSHDIILVDTTVSGEISFDTNAAVASNNTTVSGEITYDQNFSEISIDSVHLNSNLPKCELIGNNSSSDDNYCTPDDSVVTISSTASTPLKKCSSSADSESSEIIVLSDSENDAYADNVSSIRESGQTNLCATLNNTAADRIEAFLNDISAKNDTFAENSLTNINLNISLPDESVEIGETSEEDDVEKSELENEGMNCSNEGSKFVLLGKKENSKKKKDPENSIVNSPCSTQSCVEKINISATIKIKVQISEPLMVYSDSGGLSYTDDNHTTTKRHTKQKETLITEISPSCINEVNVNNSLSPQVEQHQRELNRTSQAIAKEVITGTPVLERSVELTDKAKQVLDKLYGSAWQTPEIISTLDKVDKTEDTLNFTDFHQNINRDLESTCLESHEYVSPRAFREKIDFKKPLKSGQNIKESNHLEINASPRIIKTKAGRKVAQKLPIVREMSSDEEVKDDSSVNISSYSESDYSFKKQKNKKVKNKNKRDDLVYLDLSAETVRVQEVYESPAANNDKAFNERLQHILKTCQYEDKPKLSVTPNKFNIKRKLFTPRFGEEDEEQVPAPLLLAEDISALNDTDYIKMRVPLPGIFTPINKQLEAIKTGTPIFSPKSLKKAGNSGKKTGGSSRKKKALMDEISNDSPQITEKGTIKYGFLKSLDVMVSKSLCHPEALYYRENFKTCKEQLVKRLYDLYNAKVFDNELKVPIEWNKKLLNTAGRCRNKKVSNGERSSTVELSEKVLTSPDRLRCTLIHELCHAATWIFDGQNGHGTAWKLWAKKANSIFPELPKIGVCHQYDIEYKYTYKCTLCGAKSHAHSKSKKVENIRCSFCHGAIEIYLNKKDKDGNIIPTPVKEPSGFAKFVKEKYKIHKKPNLKHADVMKILSIEFAALSVSEKSKY